LFGNSERVIDLDAKIADRAFDLGYARTNAIGLSEYSISWTSSVPA